MASKSSGACGHDFTLLLEDVHDLTDAMLDRLFEAGCDDATLSVCGREVRADFTRAGPSYYRAVISAMDDLLRAGFRSHLHPAAGWYEFRGAGR